MSFNGIFRVVELMDETSTTAMPTAAPSSFPSSRYGLLAVRAAVLAVPATIAVAILRYRLFEIDLLINRTLVDTSLPFLLLVMYVGRIVLLQLISAFVAGEGNNTLPTIGSTLAIAAVFSPLRLNVQRTIDRRFYRRKYD